MVESLSDEIVSSYLFAAFKDSRIKGDDPPFEALRLVKATSGQSDSHETRVSAPGED
jgi:hypothetical protein